MSEPGTARRRDGFLPVFGLTAVLALVQLFAVYHLNRSVKIDVGAPGDGAFVSGFWVDEADIDYRYRWTKGESAIAFKGAGGAAPRSITLRAQSAPASPVTMAVALDGKALEPSAAAVPQQVGELNFDASAGPGAGNEPVLSLSTPTFRAEGDTRDLGVKVDYALLQQDDAGLNVPPWYVLLWTIVFCAGVAGLVSRLPFKIGLGLGALFTAPVGMAAWASAPYLAAYLPTVAVVVLAAGVLVWQWRRVELRPEGVDTQAKRFPAMWLMLAAMLLYAGVALWALPKVEWIGHADYAENANVARSLVEGRGFTVDYVAQFYTPHPGISHPAETWPLLQPLLIAPFFAAFGPETWAAKLPNLFVMLALAWAVFHVGRRLWDSRVGLLAGVLVLAHPYFFNSVLYPINDLAFTAIFFALAWLVWSVFAPGSNGDAPFEGQARSMWRPVLLGALAGLLVWSKPSSFALLGGVVLWLLWAWWRKEGLRALPWRSAGIAAVVGAVVVLPLVIRNMLAFGAPFYSTESYDAWILRYWPFHNWEDIYRYYIGGELPHPRWVVGGKFGYQNLFDAFGTNLRWVWEKGVMGGVNSSDYVLGPVGVAGALLGTAALGRRAAGLFGMVLLALLVYATFVLVYWHFEGRYFEVAVPWLYLLVGRGLLWVWDHRQVAASGAKASAWELIALPVVLAALLWPHLQAIGDFTVYDTRPTSFTVAMQWLRANSGPNDVVMTRDPWESNWHSRRKAVMIPNDDLATIERVAREYGATLLQLGGPTDGIDVGQCPPEGSGGSYPTGSRPALGALYCGVERAGYEKVYQNGDLVIYRLAPRT